MDSSGLGDANIDVVHREWYQSHAQPILHRLAETGDAAEAWRQLTQLLTPQHPFALHRALLRHVQRHWDAGAKGPFPLWRPDPATVQATNLAHFMSDFQGGEEWQRSPTEDAAADLPLLQRLSWRCPERFWPQALQQLNLRFHRAPDRMLQSDGNPENASWLPGAQLNIAEAALAGDGGRIAVLWAAEDAPTEVHAVSLGELRQRCYGAAAALRRFGLKPGDAAAVYMPMSVESVVAYLGTILAGCAAVTIADSFAPREIASRLRIARCKAVFTQDVALRGGRAHPLFANVTAAGDVPAIVVPTDPAGKTQVQLRSQDISWAEFLRQGGRSASSFRPHVADAQDAASILFSSGTTGEPKAVVWSHVTPIRCGVDAWAHHDLRPGAVAAWPTNLGWMMGPWLVFGALLNRCAMALFQGPPLGRPFGDFVSAARVTMLGVVPSMVRAWRHSGCMAGLAWERHLRCFSSTGEASSPDDCQWLMAQMRYQCPILEYCGGTEIGGGYLCGTLLQPQAASAFSTPTLGAALCILLPDGSQVTSSDPSSGTSGAAAGELALVPPMLGTSQRLLNRDHQEVYFQGMPLLAGSSTRLRRHGDEVARLPGGFYRALGRADDTMNLGGIKVASADLERACAGAHESIADVAAVAVPPPGGGPDQLVVFVALRPGSSADELQLQRACQAAIRAQLNPLFKVSRVVVKEALPRTASNKLMRRLLRAEAMPAGVAAASKL